METLWQDVRYAFRGLRRAPAFTATALLSLILGLGAGLAIFTVADNLLLRPLPYRDPARLAMVWEAHKVRTAQPRNVISPGNYLDWKRQNDVFESMAVFANGRSVLTDSGRSEEFGRQYFSAELLPMLGVQPTRGRLITADDDKPSAPNVALISYRLWQTWFSGDPDIAGRKVQIGFTPATVIGVMPQGFHFIERDIDLWSPMGLDSARDYRKTSGRYLMSVALLKPGVTRDRAQSQMAAIAQRLEADYPVFDKNWTVNVEPLRDSLVRDVKPSLLILLGAVGLLLAVACANVANLLTARYTSRAREMAVRLSLGAGRSRIIRQLLTESIVLGLGGGIGGVLAARVAVKGLLALAPQDLARNASIVVDLRILAAALVLAPLTGVLFGLAPALMSARGGLFARLRSGDRSSTGSGRLRAWLVGAEVALSLILLIGASLLFRSFVGLQAVDSGLDPTNVLTFRVQIPGARYPQPESRTRFFARALDEIGQLPGVRSASAISFLPFTPLVAGTSVEIAGRPPAKPGEQLVAMVRTVMPGYFRTMGIPLRAGRDFTPADNDRAAPIRFLVNEAFVREFLRGEEPLQAHISVAMANENPFGEIVGVVADVKEGSLDKKPAPTAFFNHAHLIYTSMTFVVRGQGNPSALAAPLRGVIHGLDAEQPVADVRLMETVIGETFSRQRFSAFLLSGFSVAALLLAAIGIYGVLAYSVTERTREIGVRVALGAEPARIVALIVRSGARLILGGVVAGIAGSLALTGLLEKLLFGVKARDAATFLAAPLVLALIALLAAYIPARRAARLQPMDALRSE